MDKNTALQSYNKQVLACDPYWGSYLGELVKYFDTPVGARARVRIISNVEPPSQYAIFMPDSIFSRTPYAPESERNFDLTNLILCDYEGGNTLERILKNTVTRELESRLGQPVSISDEEWEAAKKNTLNDVYSNKFCMMNNTSADYFVSTMVEILVIAKTSAA